MCGKRREKLVIKATVAMTLCALIACLGWPQTSMAVTVRLDNSFASLGVSGGAIVYPDFVIDVAGWLDSSASVDVDLRTKNPPVSTVLTNVNPSTPLNSAFGLGRIGVVDGLMTKIAFQYGVQNDVHFNDTTGQVFGGFTGYVKSAYYGIATATGTNGIFTNQDGIFKQFALNQGAATGPATLMPTFSDPVSGQVGGTFNAFYWTTGSAFADPTTPTRSGKSEIGDIYVTVAPAKSILHGSVSKISTGSSIEIGSSGKQTAGPHDMLVGFSPRVAGLDVPIADLAGALEVTTFNWKQTVTHLPRGWTANIAESTWGADGKPTSLNFLSNNIGTGFVDHIVQDTPGVEKTYVFQTDDIDPTTGERRMVWWRQEAVDNKEPYWNLNASGVVDDFTAAFLDTPRQPKWSLDLSDSEDYFAFETRLVGVRSDGTVRDLAAEFPDAGLKWNWQSNSVHTNEVIVEGGVTGGPGSGGFPLATNSSVPDATAGGVFGVSSDLVSILGDYDGSGQVDNDDYLAWKAEFGASGAVLPADGNGDGFVNAADYTIWRDNFAAPFGLVAGGTADASGGVPEPSSMAILLTGTAFASSRCVRRCRTRLLRFASR